MKNYIGIDNGVSGSIGIILFNNNEYEYIKTPIKKDLSYTKTKKWLNRIDFPQVLSLLNNIPNKEQSFIVLERPMVNPTRWDASQSALRALETTLIAIEESKIPFQYIDSKEWQKAMLPSGLEGIELKKASLQIGKRLFPNVNWKGFTDADGILIAEYARRKSL